MRRRPCGFVVFCTFLGWGGAIPSFALHSHSDAALLCPDGNKAWLAAAEACGIPVRCVVHQVRKFTSVCPVR